MNCTILYLLWTRRTTYVWDIFLNKLSDLGAILCFRKNKNFSCENVLLGSKKHCKEMMRSSRRSFVVSKRIKQIEFRISASNPKASCILNLECLFWNEICSQQMLRFKAFLFLIAYNFSSPQFHRCYCLFSTLFLQTWWSMRNWWLPWKWQWDNVFQTNRSPFKTKFVVTL